MDHRCKFTRLYLQSFRRSGNGDMGQSRFLKWSQLLSSCVSLQIENERIGLLRAEDYKETEIVKRGPPGHRK